MALTDDENDAAGRTVPGEAGAASKDTIEGDTDGDGVYQPVRVGGISVFRCRRGPNPHNEYADT